MDCTDALLSSQAGPILESTHSISMVSTPVYEWLGAWI